MNEPIIEPQTQNKEQFKKNKYSKLKPLILVLTISLHFAAIYYLVNSFYPIARWYMNYRPIWGVDFFLTPTLAAILKQNLTWPFSYWNYAWFGGWPQFTYPSLLIYLGAIFSKSWGLINSTQTLVMAFTGLYIIGSYFFFYRISKNIIIALIFALFTALSGGVYQTLTWAGSLPSYSSQAAFPWSLGFIVWFIRTGKAKYLLVSALVAGISIFVHPLVFMTYIFPAIGILIFTNFENGFQLFKKIKHIVIFAFIALLIGLPQFYSSFNFTIKSLIKPNSSANALSTTRRESSEVEKNIAIFNKQQVKRLITDNNISTFYLTASLLAVFLLSFIVARKLKTLSFVIQFALLSLYFTFYIWLFGQGISVYHGGWYRLFWSVPVWIGGLGSSLWFGFSQNIKAILNNFYIRYAIEGIFALSFLVAGFYLSVIHSQNETIDSIAYRSQASSAYPDVLNVKVSDKDQSELKKKFVPDWLNPGETNYRLYDGDQTVNIWWNSFFNMPLSRGYLDPPIADSQRGYIFWYDAALSETDNQPQLVKSFKYPKETAISNAEFLIDWNALGYYEGGHTGNSFTPFPRYLEEEMIDKKAKIDFNDFRYTKRPLSLNYYSIKKDKTSPILSATNASTIGVFASENAYETVIRAIAEKDNLNSQKIIPIQLGQKIDDYSLSELKKFDVLYLYDYDYKKGDKAFKLLTDYVKGGKKLFIETGVEVKDSNKDLPEFFPIKKVERKGQGKQWNLEVGTSSLTNGVNLKDFAPPVFDEDEWKVSSAKDSDLNSDSAVILKNYGKILMASHKIGDGEVIWSGMNFAYHLSRNHNLEEAHLFNNILGAMVDLSQKSPPHYKVTFINPNLRTIETAQAKGILFKEQAYQGWSTTIVKSDTREGSVKIYKAGPAYPGYMYMFIPQGNNTINIRFGGSLKDKLLMLVSFFTILLILDEILIGGFFLSRLRKKSFMIIRGWWQREDEE